MKRINSPCRVLGQFAQLIQRLPAGLITLILVCHQLLVADAAVCAGLGERDITRFEQFHQMGAGDVEDIGRLLGREFSMGGYPGNRVALGHLSQQIPEQGQCLTRQDQVMAIELHPSAVCLGRGLDEA